MATHPRPGSPRAALRGAARTTVVRLGREEQARRALALLREASGLLHPDQRRELRDAHATRVALAATLAPASNVIDVGAHEGAVLERVVAIAPAGRHIAYEPLPEMHARLTERFPEVDVRRAALSDIAGTSEFVHVLDAPTYSGLRERPDAPGRRGVERLRVRTERLDDALDEGYVPRLLKIDVEGAELQVLRGAARTLRHHRPFVLFEHGIGGADLYATRSGELFDLLDDAGLRVFDLDGDGPYGRERFESTFTRPMWNFLATPA